MLDEQDLWVGTACAALHAGRTFGEALATADGVIAAYLERLRGAASEAPVAPRLAKARGDAPREAGREEGPDDADWAPYPGPEPGLFAGGASRA